MNPGSITILVVDDEPDIAQGASRALEKAGYATATALSGEEAWASVQASRPDIVLLDRDLPDVDGLDICRQIKRDPACADIFVILISGTYTRPEEQVNGLESGADGYLVRPLGNRELVARLETFVRVLRLTRSLREQARVLQVSHEKLRESEARFSSAFEDAAIGMALVAPSGQWLKVNGALCALLGYSKEELLARTFQEITYPGDLTADLDLVRRMLAGEIKTYQMEKRYLHKSGKLVWALLSVSLVRDGSGQPLHFISQVQDITERKRTQEALRKSEERLELATTSAGQGVWDWDIVHDEAYLSAKYYETSGYQQGEVCPNYEFFRSLIHPEDFPEVARTMDEHLRGETDYSIVEYRMRTKSGGWLWIQGMGKVVARDERGSPLRMVGVISDITERKRAEEEIRQSEARFREVLENSLDASYKRNLQTDVYDYLSAVIERICGYSLNEFVKLPTAAVLDLVHPDDRPEVERVIAESLAGPAGTPYQVEYRLKRKDGQYCWLRDGFVYVRDPQGQPAARIGSVRDITERKLMEEGLRHSRERYRKLADNFPVGSVCTYGHDLRMRFVAGSELKKFGVTADMFLGKHFTEVAPPETWAIAEPHLRAAFQGKTGVYETPYYDNRFYRVTVAPLYAADGTVEEIMVVSQNITERKRAEQDLRQSEHQLRALSARLETLREEERTRISREIHDELGQMLTAIKMDLRSMEHSLEAFGDDRRVNPILDKLLATAELTDSTVKTVQRIAAELRPGILDKLGLPTALEYEAAQFETRTGTACRVMVSGDLPPLPPDAATACFRIFQEALTNVARHAQATAVETELKLEAGGYRLEIRDNGKGLAAADPAKPTALGLLGMQERARLVGGEVSFGPRPGGGTIVTVRIPNSPTNA